MTTLRRVLLIAIVTLVGSGGRLGALPGSDVDNLWFDQNFGVIGEHEILCDGTHYVWGQQSGVFRSVLTESCDTGSYAKTCSYYDSTYGWTDYSCDGPPPCGFDVTCP